MAEMEDLTEFEEDDDTEYDDDCGVYLEDSCVHCQQLGSTNLLLEDKLRMVQSAMMQKEDRLKVGYNCKVKQWKDKGPLFCQILKVYKILHAVFKR